MKAGPAGQYGEPPPVPHDATKRPPDAVMLKKLLGRGPQDLKMKPPEKDDAAGKDELSREDLKDLLNKTLEVVDLLSPRFRVEYEVIEEADMVQIQVVNSEDGTIIRKIPADEVVELVKKLHQMLSERLDVKA